MEHVKKLISESFASPDRYISDKGVVLWWLSANYESDTRARRFGFRLKAKEKDGYR